MKKNTQLFVRLTKSCLKTYFPKSMIKWGQAGYLYSILKKITFCEHEDFQAIARSTQVFSISIFSSPRKEMTGKLLVLLAHLSGIYYKDKENSIQTQWKLLSDPLGSSDSHFFVFDRVEHTLSLFTIVGFGQLAFFFSSDSTQVSITGVGWWSWRSSKVTDGC